MQKSLSIQHIIGKSLPNANLSSFSLKKWRDASTMPPSTQDPSYWEEYRAYCQTREEAQLPVVSYRNYLRQWSRSARGHGKGKELKGGADGGDGKGGGPPPPPPPPLRKRQTDDTGGEAPPISKAKSGDTPSASASTSPRQARYEAARKLLLAKGYTAFPRQDPGCAGSFQDLNEHRISVPVTQALQSGLAEVEAATTDTAHALMQTFLWSRKGPNEEDLMERLSFPSDEGGGWFRFSYSSPNTLHASQLETAYHGTHVECLHGLMATGRIMPSNDKVAGMRHFDGRQGVYLHRPSNKHLAQGYAAFIRFGPKHVYLRALCEVEVDPAGSAKRGKKTNQLIFEYDSVRISAFHLQIATKSELKQGEYLREWAGTLEVPLSAALEAFEALGLSLGQVNKGGDSLPLTSSIPGGVTPHGHQGGDTPPASVSATVASAASVVEPEVISEWMGEPGSLGKYSRDAQDPESRFSISISKALAGCLRHGHHPPVTATSAGWVLLEDLLNWPRISKQHTTPGDLLEIARYNEKSRYEIGYRRSDRTYHMRAVQGHSRSDVHDDDLLERCTEETLPGVLLHGTKWHLYEAIRDQGILPQALLAQEQGRSGKGKKSSEGRRHVHLISEADRGKEGLSGFRENATMVIAVDARHAMRQGVIFYRSKNGVILTSDRIPPASILFYESLKDNQKYDRRGKPM